ncbi:glycosyltransferase family 9 protein [Azospirillum sp. RWY-5-1]|uniref:Glycosyltransferase family 9 protein n=1 Tax=Azospirillum oleiclasticum TaxID=2735135 RepID=A0ABX2TEN0_9PROT|nr:glycosyltransferase family 9 protein [Azospirillum oleiclasticum]NYZ14946.1 glycosyltransferase family 9 protein [Azospirillum oleiclasticum]NYZ22708.1 glycosyltransferase family 9 protein [Azospirillum oleiclasticum]
MSRRILVIKLGALGDFFLAQTAFQAIRAHHRGDRLSLLTIPSLAPLARRSGLFDEVLEDPRGRSPLAYLAVRRLLRAGRFDRVYDLQGQTRTERYFWLIAPGPWPEWSGPARGASHSDRYPGRKSMPAVERHSRQLRAFGIELPPDPDLSWLDGEAGLGPIEPYAMLIPGSAPHRPEKRWPAERYGALARLLLTEGLRPVIAGGKAEMPLAAAIHAVCPEAADLTGRTDLFGLAALARRAAVAVGNDTGPTHMAAALGTPTLALFVDQPTPIQVTGPHVLVHHRPDFATMTAEGVMDDLRRLRAS